MSSVFDAVRKEYEAKLKIPTKKSDHQFFLCPIGLVGAGKTTVMKPLSKKLNLLRISTDEIRELFKARDLGYEKTEEIFEEIFKKYALLGYSIGVDADCVREEKIAKLKKIAKKLGVKIVWIHINPSEKFILSKFKNLKYKKSGLFLDEKHAVETYLARKPLHKKLNFPFLYVFDTSRKDLKKQIDEAVVLVRKMANK